MDASEGGGTERRRSTRTKALSSLKKKSTRGEESIKRARKSSLPEETSSRDEEWEANYPMEEEEEENSSSDEERRRKRRRRRESQDKDTTGDTECPHCHKKLSSALGYQYHVDQFVCRPSLRPGGPSQSRGRRRKSVSEQQQQYPRIRGKNVEDRTCPLCQRVFTSVTGMQYHRDKRVCEQKSSDTTTTTPYATIAPGQCFVTPYGIVQVLCDDRATPTAMNDESSKSKMKLYYSALAKREARHQKQMTNVAVVSEARRMLLHRAFEKNKDGNVDALEIRNIYQACRSARTTSLQPRSVLEDPSAPPDSFPDRIVEGILIPDQRPRYIGPTRKPNDDTYQDFSLLEGLAITTNAISKIFLPRRLLTTLYSPESSRYYCPLCYQCFVSKPGYKYHVDLEACRVKARAKSSALEEQRNAVHERAQQFVHRYDQQGPLVPAGEAAQASKNESTDMSQAIIPPPITETFVVLNSDDEADVLMSSTLPEQESNDFDPSTIVSPDAILAKLEAEFYRLQGSMIGPMYPCIWKALGYRKPVVKRKRLKRVGSMTPAPIVSAEILTIPSTTDRPDLPIIDIYPLVQEVDAGRYPSMKRYNNDSRDDKCAICKQKEFTSANGIEPKELGSLHADQTLIPCNFCRQVEHFTCAQAKFIIKFPEPGDDFMCHNCIGIVSARRSRAEKRRLEKLDSNGESSASAKTPSLHDQQYGMSDSARLKDLYALTRDVVRDREYECVAAQGSRLDELAELLRDGKTRLTLRMEAMNMNHTRLSLIETAYNNDGIE